jgi:hypothetical protein
MWFWGLVFLGSIFMFFDGYKAATADAQVCTYMGDELIDCDSGPMTMMLAVAVGALAAWRLYVNWTKIR